MKNKNFLKMKVFDCQDMPQDLRKKFFIFFEKNNDCYVKWEVENDLHPNEFRLELDKWLIENGAKASTKYKCGETVIIRHWW